jgi:hypothetical protein
MTETPSKSRSPAILLVACGVAAVCLIAIVGAVAAFLIVRGRTAKAAEPTIEYILDASPRMETASNGDTRISTARGIMAEIVRTADPRLTAALRVFGTGAQPQGCQDTDLVVPFATANQAKIEGRLGGVEADPGSDSPLAQAMIAAIRDMASTDGPHSMVVVTGGADSCNPEAAELIRQEADRAGIELRVFVVGFDMPPEEIEAVKAMVALIPGATYVEAPDEASLRDALYEFQGEVDRMAAEVLDTGPSERAAATACDHPYLPLRTGATWTYSGSDGQLTWSISSAGGSPEAGSATMEMAMPSVNMTVHWNCSSAGIVSYDFASIRAAEIGDVATMDIVDNSGTWLPPAERLTPGSSWGNEYTIVMNVPDVAEIGNMSTVISETWSVGGEETVSVPAGTFEAIRIDGTANMTVSTPMGEVPSITMSMSYWFARDVGIVRFTNAGEGFSSQSDLTSYSIP